MSFADNFQRAYVQARQQKMQQEKQVSEQKQLQLQADYYKHRQKVASSQIQANEAQAALNNARTQTSLYNLDEKKGANEAAAASMFADLEGWRRSRNNEGGSDSPVVQETGPPSNLLGSASSEDTLLNVAKKASISQTESTQAEIPQTEIPQTKSDQEKSDLGRLMGLQGELIDNPQKFLTGRLEEAEGTLDELLSQFPLEKNEVTGETKVDPRVVRQWEVVQGIKERLGKGEVSDVTKFQRQAAADRGTNLRTQRNLETKYTKVIQVGKDGKRYMHFRNAMGDPMPNYTPVPEPIQAKVVKGQDAKGNYEVLTNINTRQELFPRFYTPVKGRSTADQIKLGNEFTTRTKDNLSYYHKVSGALTALQVNTASASLRKLVDDSSDLKGIKPEFRKRGLEDFEAIGAEAIDWSKARAAFMEEKLFGKDNAKLFFSVPPLKDLLDGLALANRLKGRAYGSTSVAKIPRASGSWTDAQEEQLKESNPRVRQIATTILNDPGLKERVINDALVKGQKWLEENLRREQSLAEGNYRVKSDPDSATWVGKAEDKTSGEVWGGVFNVMVDGKPTRVWADKNLKDILP